MLKRLNAKTLVNECQIQYIEQVNDEYFLITSLGFRVSIGKELYDELIEYEGNDKGINWNIMSSTTPPTSETPGQIGDILIVTSSAELVKKIKYVATKVITDAELQDNSINVYEDFTRDRVLVNRNNGFNMYIWATQQNIMVNGEVMIANVFFYDGLTNSWKQYNSAYKEALNVNSFTGSNINVDELWTLSYTDSINENRLLPPMHKEQIADALTALTFAGANLDVDTLYPSWNLSEEVTANNLTIV